MLLDYLEIPLDDFFKQLAIKNGIAYGLENFKLSLLDLQVAGKYQLIKEIEFSEPTRAFFIEKQRLSVLSEDRSNLWITCFDLSNPVAPLFQGKVTVPMPYYYQQAAVFGNYFYGLTQLKNRSDYVFNFFNIQSSPRLPTEGFSREVGYHKVWQGPWLYSIHNERMLRIFHLDFIPDSTEMQSPPTDLTLYPGFPNPFRTSTQIRFYIETPRVIQVEIFNILGQKVRVLTQGKLEPGFNFFDWDGNDSRGALCVNGIYFARLKAARKGKSIKLVKLK